MAQRHKVGTVEALGDGGLHAVDAGGTSVVVGLAQDGLCAARNRCPHMGLPLSRGPGGKRLEEGEIVCPWHNSRFDLASGENRDWAPGIAGMDMPKWSHRLIALGRKPAPLTTYEVSVEDGDVYVTI